MNDFSGSTPVFRIYERYSDGRVEDLKLDMGLADFAGVCPTLGDLIVEAGVRQGIDRNDFTNRRLWKVVGRVFNPRDLREYVVLIIESSIPTAEEAAFVTG